MARYSNLSKNIETIIEEIQKQGGSVRSNWIVKHMEKNVEESRKMSHQTTRNALKTGTDRGLIEKISDKIGNQVIVKYSTNPAQAKIEQTLLDQADVSIKWFDIRYDELEKNYKNLPIYFKAEGVYSLAFFLKVFRQTIEVLETFSPSRKWENVLKQIDLRGKDLSLLTSANTDEGLEILQKFVSFHLDVVDGAIEDVEDYFKEIEEFPNYKTKDLEKSPI